MADLPDMRYALGGNAPVMTKRFHKEGVQVLLGASMSSALRRQLDSNIKGLFKLWKFVGKMG